MALPFLKIELPATLSGRLPVLDELKGLAIMLIVLYHAGGVLVWGNYLHGDVGVDMFLVLSGMGLVLGSGFTTPGEFLKKRLSRILPAYWIVLTLFLLGNTYILQKQYTGGNIVTHYLGIHAWFGEIYALSINDSFWFISLILALYVLYCWLHAFSSERVLLIGAVISTGVALIYFLANQPGTFAHLGMHMPGFFIGVVLARLLKEGRLEISSGVALSTAFFVLAYIPYTRGIIFAQVVVGLAVMGFYALVLRPRLVRSSPSVLRVLTFLGDHSLEIFLLHQPLIREYVYYCLGRFAGITQPTAGPLIFAMLIGFGVTLFLSVELKSLLKKISFK